MNENILYFLHIPKTGGTTFMDILDDHFDYDSIFPEQSWRNLYFKSSVDFSQYGLVRGHFGYGIHRLLPEKTTYMTFLRNPYTWIISWYEHLMHAIENQNVGVTNFLSQKSDLMSILNDKQKNKVFTNNQTRHIGLDLDVLELTKYYSDISSKNFFFDSLKFFIDDVNNKKLLSIAKKRISEFSFVGITEKFEESLMLLCYIFRWKPVYNIQKLNVTKNHQRNKISSLLKQKIQEHTNLDSELYSFAEKLFEQRFNDMIEILKQKYYKSTMDSLTPKQMIYQMLEKHYEDKFEKKKIDSINYTFSKKLVGRGWHSREFLPNTKNCFRWTGPENYSDLDFPNLKEQNYKFSFDIINSTNPDILKHLTIKFNNKMISFQRKDNSNHFYGKIPKSIIDSKNNFIRLSFHMYRTIIPTEINKDSKDTRKLGIAISKIQILPENN